MVAKKRLLGVAVVLGVALAAVSQLRWMAKRERAAASEAAPTNAVVATSATNAVAKAKVKVKGEGEQRKDTNSIVRLPTPNLQPPTPNLQLSTPNLPPPKARKPIAYDPKIPKARQVLLANRRIAVASGRSFPKKFCAAQAPTARGTAPYVLVSEPPVSRDVRIQVVADGAKVVGFLPNNALLVEADAQALKYLEDDPMFTAAVEYEPTDKIQRALLADEGETVEATVVLLNEVDRETVQKFVTDNGGTLLPGAPSERSVSATIPRGLVVRLAGKAEVKWIERHGKLKLLNDVAVTPGLMNVTPVREAPLNLTGAGQIITTSDTGIDTGSTRTMHADLSSAIEGIKAVNSRYCTTKDVHGHGTHTAGSIVGRGTKSSGQFMGAAPGAKLWAWGMADANGKLYTPSSVEELFRPSIGTWYRPKRVDAYIHSASWGDNENMGAYTSWVEEVDEYVWGHADFLPVFAAGNDGQTQNTINVPGTGKNILTVGACENVRSGKGSYADNAAQIAYFSSCGPCDDGRIKPDIVAPGTFVISTRSSQSTATGWGVYDSNYLYNSGTSMATPLTAGTAALVREWLVKHRAQSNPSAALVKAILTGGATDLKNGSGNNVLKNVPDTRQGWGRVNLADAIAPAGMGVFLADRLPFRAGTNFTFRVTTTNAAPLNVQLVWVDYPGDPSAARALVNDLDLRVTAAGQTWLGNGGTARDDVNNVESVRIQAAARRYAITVDCTAIRYDCDEGGAAAIYIRGAFDPQDVTCAAPAGTIWTIR